MIQIPDKHYAGYRYRDECVLGFLAPYSDDSAGVKRRRTVNNWRDTTDETLEPDILDNELMEGFRIGRNVSRCMTSNVVWRVMDPRGFELEITSSNLHTLLDDTAVTKGYIEGKCIWAREGKHNVLVHENSEEYKNATDNSDRIAKRVTLKDVKLGDTILLHDGRKGVYFGPVHIFEHPEEKSEWEYDGPVYDQNGWHNWINPMNPKRKYVVKIESTEKEMMDGKDAYVYSANNSLKVSEIVSSLAKPLTKAAALEELRNHMLDVKMQKKEYWYSDGIDKRLFITNEYSKKNLKFGLDEITQTEMNIQLTLNPITLKCKTGEDYRGDPRYSNYDQYLALSSRMIEHEGQKYLVHHKVNDGYECRTAEYDEKTGSIFVPEHRSRTRQRQVQGNSRGHYYSHNRHSEFNGLPNHDSAHIVPNSTTKYFLFNASVAGDKIPYRIGDKDD